MSEERKMRDARFDIVKGVMMLLVVFGHIPRIGYLASYTDVFANSIYLFHTSIFMLVSGYFFSGVHGEWRDVTKIVRRLLVPYFIMAPAFVAFYWLAARMGISTTIEQDEVSLLGIVRGQVGGALWFLYSLVAIGLPLSLYFVARRSFQGLPLPDWFAPFVSIGFALMLNRLNGRIVVEPFCVAYFLLGYIGRRCNFEMAATPLALFFGIPAFLAFPNAPRATLPNLVWVFSVFSFVLWFGERTQNCLVGRLLEYVGRRSMALLLFHPLICAVVRVPIFKLSALSIFADGLSCAIIVLVVTAGLCLLADRVLMRSMLGRCILGETP